ncbi:MAG TPA: hypothetical protein VMB66_09720 [Candidatus Acidoferrales bacterium]|nr:hypothetical protein [Candidatus Acidoferrales bacterium]
MRSLSPLPRTAAPGNKVVFFAHMPAGSLSFDPAGRDQLNFDFVALAYDKKEWQGSRSGR